MIRKFIKNDIDVIMQIWLETNIKAHNFIEENYWKNNFEQVKLLLPQSELYVYIDDVIKGFIGLNDTYIEGIFVLEKEQSKGIGKQLLDYVKILKNELTLNVYKKNKQAIDFYKRENFKIISEDFDQATQEEEYCMKYIK